MVKQVEKDLKKLNMTELKEMSKKLGVKGYSKLRKGELIDVLKILATESQSQNGGSKGKKRSPKKRSPKKRPMKGGGTVGAPHSETWAEWGTPMANAEPVQQLGGSPTGMPMRYFNEAHPLRAPNVPSQNGGSPTGMPMRYFNEAHSLRAPNVPVQSGGSKTKTKTKTSKRGQKGGNYTRGGTLQEQRELLKAKMRKAQSPLRN